MAIGVRLRQAFITRQQPSEPVEFVTVSGTVGSEAQNVSRLLNGNTATSERWGWPFFASSPRAGYDARAGFMVVSVSLAGGSREHIAVMTLAVNVLAGCQDPTPPEEANPGQSVGWRIQRQQRGKNERTQGRNFNPKAILGQ